MATVETEPHSLARTVSEQCGDQPEPETELSLTPPALSSPSAFDLVEVTKASSSTLTVGLISMPDFRFLEVVPLKTPFPRIVPMVAAPAIPESSMMVLP